MKAVKALPAPIEASRKKRGGRRVRKMKERYATTDYRKQANRMNFGEVKLPLERGSYGVLWELCCYGLNRMMQLTI